MEKVDIIGWMDLTKFGVLTQKDINRVGAWADKLVSKNVAGPSALILFVQHRNFLLIDEHDPKPINKFKLLVNLADGLRCLRCSLPAFADIHSRVWCSSVRYPDLRQQKT